ncbi:phage virion morphogenesis protein [uncultured Deefgea sp.]|uniref:phage virion morphogenesis protein n=1 Tax=uncultured Deefgea sp. TaxID=1304914 RepID=UPI00259162AD|nr:phage virion morphogenesis protein [uncultured Deefgea sp.]
MIEITFDVARVSTALNRLISSVENPQPILRLIGEKLMESTKNRFDSSTAPDGSRWKPNAMATHIGHAGKYGGSFRKDGKLSAKGAGRVMGKKPLIGESGALSGGISYRLVGNSVEIGSGMQYAAIHQFGGKAGRGRKVTIVARPFLGLSANDEQQIESLVLEGITRALRG